MCVFVARDFQTLGLVGVVEGIARVASIPVVSRDKKKKKVSVGLAFSWAQVWPRAEKTKLLQKYASFSSRPRMKKFLKLIARSEKKMIGEHEKVLHAYLVS